MGSLRASTTTGLALMASLAGVLALSSASRPARAEEVNDTVRSVLEDPRYRFCHEDDYPLAPDEHAWCPIVGDATPACPSFAKACKLPAVERLPYGMGRFRRARPGEDPAARPVLEDARQRPASCNASAPDLSAMSGAAQVVFIGMLVAFAVFLVRLLVKNFVRAPAPAEPEPAKQADAQEDDAPAARGAVETDVERLLARARASAAQGSYARAVDDAYAALLRRLDGDGLIEIHPSRTNGDYVRALGDRAELRRAVRTIVRDVEDVQFGSTPPSEPVFRSILERVVPIATRAAGMLLLLFGLGAVLSCGTGDDEPGVADTSPSGTQALIEVMSKHGVTLRRRSEPLEKLDSPLALVLLPDAVVDEATWTHLLGWVDKGGSLIVAGAASMPADIEQRIAGDTEDGTTLTVAPGHRWVGHPRLSLPPGRRVAPALAGDGGTNAAPSEIEGAVLHRGASVVLTEREVGDGRIVVVADDRLFTNAALIADDDASFVLGLLFRSAVPPERVVELCDAWTGAGAKTPLESVSRANLTPFVVQLFVLLALFFLWKGRAFARLRDPPSEGRRAFVDHARALGLAYRRARASRHVTGLYAVWALERLRERVHRAGRQGLIPLAEAIAARTGKPEADVMRVLVEAAGARDDAAPPSSFRPPSRREPKKAGETAASDLALMRELESFLDATGGKRRPERPPPDPHEPSP